MNLKLQVFQHKCPQADELISLWTEREFITCPWKGTDSQIIALVDVSQQAIEAMMTKANQRAEDLAQLCRRFLSHGAWDITIKPILWFENSESIAELQRLLEGPDSADQLALIDEMQMKFNDPWGEVRKISSYAWKSIEEAYRK